MVKFNSDFLNNLQQKLIANLTSGRPFSVKIGSETHQFTEEERKELLAFFDSNQQLVVRPISNDAILRKRQDDEFRRRLERTLFKSIYPNDWEIIIMIKNLEMYLGWKDKRQRTIVAIYEPYIARALNSLLVKKKKWDNKIGWPSQENKI